MNWLKSTFFVALIGAGVATPMLLRRNSDNQLRGKLELLEQQKDRLALLEAENARLVKRPAQINTSLELPPEKLSELLKLRSEVGALQSQADAIPKLQAENRKLHAAAGVDASRAPRASQPVTDGSPGEFVPRESWAFAGYATPEASLQTLAWAMSKGDRNMIFRGLDGEAAEQIGKQVAGKSDDELAAEMANAGSLSGYRILDKQVLSGDEVLMKVAHGDDTNRGEIMKFKKIGGEWKFTGAY